MHLTTRHLSRMGWEQREIVETDPWRIPSESNAFSDSPERSDTNRNIVITTYYIVLPRAFHLIFWEIYSVSYEMIYHIVHYHRIDLSILVNTFEFNILLRYTSPMLSRHRSMFLLFQFVTSLTQRLQRICRFLVIRRFSRRLAFPRRSSMAFHVSLYSLALGSFV